MLRVQTDDQLETVQAAAQQRLDTQTNTFAGYAPEQYALCKDGSAIVIKGQDVMFVISADKDAAVRVPRGTQREGGRMKLTELLYPFAFLPVCLVLYYVLPKRCRNAALLAASLLVFAWGTPEYLVLLVLAILLNYFAGLELESLLEDGRRAMPASFWC